MKILVVEDNEEYIETYKVGIKNFNEKNGLKIDVEYAQNIKSWFETIQKNEFDGAIIDLNLPRQDSVTTDAESIYNQDGEKIIEDISMERRFPIAVVSAFADSIDEKYKIKEGLFLRIYQRGDEDIDKILSEFVQINKMGIAKIFGRTGKIEEFINKIYYDNIQSTLKAEDKGVTEDRILRYFSMVLQEYLDIENVNGGFTKYGQFEFYIAPPVKKFHFTGEIIKIKRSKGNGETEEISDKYVILTPACDMVERDGNKCKCENDIVCIKVISGDDIIKIEGKTAKNKENQNKYLDDDIKPNRNQRYHYLPEVSDIMDKNSFIDFRRIITLDRLDDNIIESVATISAPFLKDIIARFSYYYSRQGQPELK